VRVAIGDMKLPENEATSTRGVSPFLTDEKTINDYYPFGMTIAERSWQSTGYRYGYNQQEKSLEIDANGNHNTAEFWEYDTRTGRRWNLDPVVKPWESNYATFASNPIQVIDPNGDDGYFTPGTNQTSKEVLSFEQRGIRENIENLDEFLGYNSKIIDVDFNFDWNSSFPHFPKDRQEGAEQLAKKVLDKHNNYPEEDISLYGYSCGGDVNMRSIPIIRKGLIKELGILKGMSTKIHLITLSTPMDYALADKFIKSGDPNVNWIHIYLDGDDMNSIATKVIGTIPSIPEKFTHFWNKKINFKQYQLKSEQVTSVEKEFIGGKHGWPYFLGAMENLINSILKK